MSPNLLNGFRCCFLGDQWWSSWWPVVRGYNWYECCFNLKPVSGFPPKFCLSNLCRRVSFPMGSYGAPTLKFTVWQGWKSYKPFYFDYSEWATLYGESIMYTAHVHVDPVCVGLAQLRVWGTLPGLSSLRLPLDVKQLRCALERTGVQYVSFL